MAFTEGKWRRVLKKSHEKYLLEYFLMDELLEMEGRVTISNPGFEKSYVQLKELMNRVERDLKI